MFSIAIGIFLAIKNISFTGNHKTKHGIQTTKKINVSASQKKQLLTRKQYQNNFNQTYSQQKKEYKKNRINRDFLEFIETRDRLTQFDSHPIKKNPIKKQLSKNNDDEITKQTKIAKKTSEKQTHTYTKTKPQTKKKIDITAQLKELQIIVDNLDEKSKQIVKNQKSIKEKYKSSKKHSQTDEVGYWQTVYSIESKQGKLLYRPRNKARNCNYTLGPCGHHQLTVQALRDIGCKSLQCRKDRLDFNKSLQLSKKLLALNEKRLRKNGLVNLEGYQKYLIHQQGANGIKNIIAATKGKKELSKTIKKNMANNSPYSYKQYKRMGSKIAAKKFMQHWKKKWMNEKRMILASNSKTTKRQINLPDVPTFNDNDLNYALNLMF